MMRRLFNKPIHAWLALGLVLLVLVEAGNLLFVPNAVLRGNVSDVLQTVAAFLAMGMFVAGTRRLLRDGSPAAKGWMLFAAGALLFAMGQVVFWLLQATSHSVRYPNLSDPFHLSALVVLLAGLMRLAREDLPREERQNALIDFACLTLLTGVAVWELSLRDLLWALLAAPNGVTAIALAYTLLDLTLLFALYYRLVVNLGRGRMLVPNLLLVGAGICETSSDLAFSGAAAAGGFASGSPIDIGWVLTGAFAGLAGLFVLDQGDPQVADHRPRVLSATWSTSLSYGYMALVLALLVWASGEREAFNTTLLALATGGVLLLTGVRQVRTVRRAARVTDQLTQAQADLEAKVGQRTTELESANRALRASESLWRYAFGHSPMLMTISDLATGKYYEVNDAFCLVSGFSRDEAIGRTSIGIGFLDADSRELMVHALMHSGRLEGIELTLHSKQGKRLVCRYWGEVIITDRGPHLFSTAIDVTTQSEAEELLRESEARYRTLFEQSGDYILVLEIVPDRAPVIADVNQAAVRLLGYSREELIGQPISFIDPDGGVPGVLDARARLVAKTGNAMFEVRHQRKDGSLFDVEVTASELMLDGKRYSISTERDITDRKRADAERVRLESELAQSQKLESVGRLAGGVAHDFNNMLGVIIGHAEQALDQVSSSFVIHDDLVQILAAGKRSAALTRQLLAFARRQAVIPKVIDLNETVGGMLRMLGRLIGEHIALEWMPGSAIWPVRMDPSQLDQILANLCVNSRDAISTVGRISITTSNCVIGDTMGQPTASRAMPGEYVRLTVADTGCGMDPSMLSRIFEPFFTTKEVGEGTGLGLSTVYGAVRQNNGYIDVQSAVGEGTTFTLYLPRHVGKPDSEGAHETDGHVTKGGETILLVEDELALLALTSRMLENMGYTVLAATSPSEAIQKAAEHAGKFQLLLSDVVMPEMQGFDLARKLRATYPHLHVLFMSGYTANVMPADVVGGETTSFLAKPFGAAELAAKVREVLDRPVVAPS